MKTFRRICVILLAGVFIFSISNISANKQQISQYVRILENNIDKRGIKVICIKDTEELKNGDICVLYPGKDTTIRKMDGTVIAREDLEVGETVRLQHQSVGLEYKSKKQMYCISRIAFILKPEAKDDAKDSYQNAVYISDEN